MDPLDTETSRFCEDFRTARSIRPGKRSKPRSSPVADDVFRHEENGSLVNSARWLQWHWKAAELPGDAKADIWIMARIFHRMREMYAWNGSAFPDPILNLTWDYTDPIDPNPEELAEGYEWAGAGRISRTMLRCGRR